ncbi:DUF4233 domain-containing protein [Streptomyces sp. NEAU-H3]|uniref:DUF4233 domain-containing protein n=1 Tax=Streptomyces sp. NEAU-H3 TaxID=2720636 RepID=UPI001438C713|nr:DUF4233 domain-containing protein [Streptomyces sp. NEAU-H3]NJA56259.1 DUF4233 domain-containing protein [Streptomyces sp. NEAU-H3]
MRTLCASTLIGEFLIIGFAGLVAMKMDALGQGTVWGVCGGAMLLCVLLCGVVTRPAGVALGWVLQVALFLSGFVVPVMFILGAAFGGLWWASVKYGRKIDEVKARYAAENPSPLGGTSRPEAGGA